MQKYVNDSACLQINISGGLRSSCHRIGTDRGPPEEVILKMFKDIREELWQLMRDSFTRFRATVEYKKLCEVLVNLPKFQERVKNGHSSPRHHEHPPSVDYNIKNNNMGQSNTHINPNNGHNGYNGGNNNGYGNNGYNHSGFH